MARRHLTLTAAIAALALAEAPAELTAQEAFTDRIRRILAEVPLIDGHNDLPGAIREAKTPEGDVGIYDLRQRTSGDTDLGRLRAGMVGAQFWSVHVDVEDPTPAKQQLEQIDIAHRVFAAYPDALEFAGTASDIERVFGAGKIASLLGIEGGHVIENSLGALRAFYRTGVRYMTLTHFTNTDWADSATDDVVNDGLSPFGEEVVREMNRMGMLVDLSHVSPATMSDVLDLAEAPVIFSHSGSRALADHPRNVPDSILRRLPANGGIVMQVFYPPYVGRDAAERVKRQDEMRADLEARYGGDPQRIVREMAAWNDANPAPGATLADVADHIEHIRDVAGIDHVGLGSDFDGIPTYVEGLEDVSTFPALLYELARRGWSDEELKKLAGENLLRVMRAAELAAMRLQLVRTPSTRTIEEMDGRINPPD